MAREHMIDRVIKEPLIRDTIALVDPLPFDRDALIQALVNFSTKPRPAPATSGPGHKEKDRDSSASSAGSIGSTVRGTSGRKELDAMLSEVLLGRRPRSVGETPRFLGGYEPLAPHTEVYDKCMKVKAGVCRSGVR